MKYDDLRSVLANGLGEIIEYCLGQRGDLDRAQDNGGHLHNIPIGMRAVDSGVINNDVREGLLIAQAAERTLRAVEATESFLDSSRDLLLQKGRFDWRGDIHYDDADSVFAHIGLSFDTDELVKAQAIWHLAVMMENNEKRAVAAEIKRLSSDEDGWVISLDRLYLDGFRQAAAVYFRRAADVIEAAGQAELAAALYKIADEQKPENKANDQFSPQCFARKLWKTRQRAGEDDEILSMIQQRMEQVDDRPHIVKAISSGRRDYL